MNYFTQNFAIRVLDKLQKCWHTLLDDLDRRRRVLVAAKVGDGPSDVAQERHRHSSPGSIL